MIRKLLFVALTFLTLSSYSQDITKTDSTNDNFKNSVQNLDSILENSLQKRDDSKQRRLKKRSKRVSKKQLRNSPKGATLIAIVDRPELDSSYTKNDLYSTPKTFTSRRESPIRPAFRPISAEQMEQLHKERKQIINTQPNRRIVNMLNYKPEQSQPKTKTYYWILEETINGNSSTKSMKLVEQSVAIKLISKNKLETKTKHGRFNTLTVWEVFNKERFMEEQIENPDYYKSYASHLFNVEPYYKTSDQRLALK